ncbi:MAG TPA: ATP-binding cassette domain-containing protein [Nitrospirota bacterium]|nr:ATP-binding cassette domain-containing protein [Nitrospirota bacterium]
MNAFSLRNVSYSYGNGHPVLADLSIDIGAGERIAILGANGTGKSTLLSLLDGLAFPQEGIIHVFGKPLSEHSLENSSFSEDFRKRVAFIFQNPDVQLFSSSVWEEVAFGPLQLGFSRIQVASIVEDLLDTLRISDLRDRPPYTLSDGQKKKVAIASSLATDPDVLLLDEPTNGLDPRTQVWLIQLLDELHHKGKTIITATHDLSIAGDIAERAIVLSEEHSVAGDGPFWDIINNEDLLLKVNLIHEHAHRHGQSAHVHRHGHFGHYHANGGSLPYNHEHHGEDRDSFQTGAPETGDLKKLLIMLEHWIDHGDNHVESYREWADRAIRAGEGEIAREIHLAIAEEDSAKNHFKRARDVIAEKIGLKD